MNRIALYVRVSTEEQAQIKEGSLKSQEQRLREHVQRRNEGENWGKIVGVFIEAGKSAKDTNRPELQKMLLGIKQHLFDLVLVTEISRLSRSTRDFCNMMDLFQVHGCKVLSLREQFDTTSAAGEMMMHMLMNFAQFERKQTSERIKANFKARAKRGLYNGGISPLGYMSDIKNKGRLLIVKEEAKIVRECYKTFLEKGSLSSAAKELNRKGFRPTKLKTGSNKKYVRIRYFNSDYVYRVLTNPVYIAKKVICENGKDLYVDAQWKPMIDEETFFKIKKTLKANRYRNKPRSWKHHPYLLSGLIECGECGRPLAGRSAYGRNGKYIYYDHGMTLKVNYHTNKPGCPCRVKRVKAIPLETAIIGNIKNLLLSETVISGMIEQAKSSTRAEEINKNIQNQKNRIKETKWTAGGELETNTLRG